MIALSFLIILSGLIPSSSADPMLDRVRKQGISIDCHFVTTSDNYILRLYHLVRPTNETIGETSRPKSLPIFLMHGMLGSSQDFVFYPKKSAGKRNLIKPAVITDTDQSEQFMPKYYLNFKFINNVNLFQKNFHLGYYFYENHHDVWLGNARGNTFSRNHTTLDPKEMKFWKYSWHEIGVYDLPAIIDYILNQTKQDQLIYVGHSQGSTVVFALLAERPEYNKKISSVHVTAVPVILKHYMPSLDVFIHNIVNLKTFAEEVGLFEILRYRDVKQIAYILAKFCAFSSITSGFCRTVVEQIFGPFAPNSYYNNLLVDFAKCNPSGSSYMQFLHYAQLCKSGRFQKYDFGVSENTKLYGRKNPPEYNLSNIQTKIHIIYGSNDYVAKAENIPILLEKINSSIVAVNKMNLYNHGNFMVGRLVQVIPPIILDVINRLNEVSSKESEEDVLV